MADDPETGVEASVRAWISVLDDLSFYEILGVAENASDGELKEAFHRFAESFHPDRHRHRSPELRNGVTAIFRKGVEGYRLLGSPKRRSAYNFELTRHRLRLSGAPPSAIPMSLDELCRTPGGKLHGRQAERALSEGDLRAAAALIDRALIAEGPSADLEARKRAVTDALELSTLSPEPVVDIPGSPRVPTPEIQEGQPQKGQKGSLPSFALTEGHDLIDSIEPDLIEPDLIEPDLIEPDLIEPDLIEPDPAAAAPMSASSAPPRPAGATSAPPCPAGATSAPPCPAGATSAPPCHPAETAETPSRSGQKPTT